ncbi:MAG: phosphatase PAP2 family protein [Clostridia bacterium]
MVEIHSVALQSCVEFVLRMDAGAASFVNPFCRNRVFDMVMPLVTLFGDGLVLAVVWIGLYIRGDGPTRRAASLGMQALIILGLAAQIAKWLVGRERPLGGSFDSFPSGHTTEAFSAALVLGDRWRKLRVVLLALAILVAFSRVYLMAHYLSDVAAGAALGAGGAALLLWAARRTSPKPDRNL